jgi:hypothetical protein
VKRQHEIISSDRSEDGPGEGQVWLINTEDNGYNNGRQVVQTLLSPIKRFCMNMIEYHIQQFAFTVESKAIFDEWDTFLEAHVTKAKDEFRKQTEFEKAKVKKSMT